MRNRKPMDKITYRKLKYKYQLLETFEVRCLGLPWEDVSIPGKVKLDAMGLLRIVAGYSWDGPSGPAIHTPSFMRGSLVHDALYQLMRAGLLDPTTNRILADRTLRNICLEDGMHPFRAWYVYQVVRAVGERYTRPIITTANRYQAP